MVSKLSEFSTNTSSFGAKGLAIAKSDSADIAGGPVKAITVTAAGSLSFIPPGNADNDPISYADVPVGFIPPYQVRRVKSTGTTATVRTIED
ncbi:hypothetical protein HNR60_000667 [Rhodopseudomonas rhenobacensis]|uniref:Uncharacterized protein n=1 Tax=Rhodopseudomonas rhenobacensis TaxID=87461 RepID=A0A7W8DXN4_9BRAD|nr:hypothetical protein [Rhodopseudomonas rhenobacensis]MBB5045932.1 hypothetical protein [Rhodopseudomonas rhenobacensis]